MAEDARADVVLASHEAAANAVDHANTPHPIEVRGRLVAHTVVIEVRDKGAWLPAVEHNDERGRGLLLIAALMHDLKIRRNPFGTTLRMTYRLARRDSEEQAGPRDG